MHAAMPSSATMTRVQCRSSVPRASASVHARVAPKPASIVRSVAGNAEEQVVSLSRKAALGLATLAMAFSASSAYAVDVKTTEDAAIAAKGVDAVLPATGDGQQSQKPSPVGLSIFPDSMPSNPASVTPGSKPLAQPLETPWWQKFFQ